MSDAADKLTLKEASLWATNYLGKEVTPSNITYLINYGRIRKITEDNESFILCSELKNYYQSYNGTRESKYTDKIGDDLNWALSFDSVKESETTKHVHRLHPYKGKFIPQLVEYFLDQHTDKFKKQIYFRQGDIVLDPFCGSGTTLIQANELGIHAVGIDISAFNTLISNVKISEYDLFSLQIEISKITAKLKNYISSSPTLQFEKELTAELTKFNNKYFPNPEFRIMVYDKKINERQYGQEKEKEFLKIYNRLTDKYNIELISENPKTFIDKWYMNQIKNEINFVYNEICKIENQSQKDILTLILSRTMRSCRATTHSDLATLKEPVTAAYYCRKHGKICRPIFSILRWWISYSQDTIKRVDEFSRLRTGTYQQCITGDSRTLDIQDSLSKTNPKFAELLKKQKIKGIFTSPPYVGLINYHEQHAYAYDLFKFERNDDSEIGAMFKGQGYEARESYVKGISDVLNNTKRFLADDFEIFLVANDKYNLYPKIAEMSDMKIVEQFRRPVLNRTEKDKSAYSEIIFHLKSDYHEFN